ncbi:aminotransferase class I/II-fold pyridoxal phosphate-dependent enzyme [archaeon]|nr:MAG: aminotransferase class I/II-fold pyridoxal phosphate-dependent enzyme [archaeon]
MYQVIVDSLGGRVKHYPLLPHKNWECDLEVDDGCMMSYLYTPYTIHHTPYTILNIHQSMEKLIDSHTKAILINNPSNPCGSNFSPQHLLDIAAVARKHHLPIIADEIYGKFLMRYF